MIHAIRTRPAGAPLVLVVLLGLLGAGAAAAAAGDRPARHPGLAAAPPHAERLVLRNQDPGLRALGERRRAPIWTVALLGALLGTLVRLGLSGLGARPGPAGGARGRGRRFVSRAPPRRLQPA